MSDQLDKNYDASHRPKEDMFENNHPLHVFELWLSHARKLELNDPEALALSTVDKDGLPNCRMVLLKNFGEEGFSFATNYSSAKGKELEDQPRAAMLFHWKSIRRQVRIRGNIEKLSAEDSMAIFEARPRGSRLGAWASKQSQPLESRFALEKRVAKYAAKYAIGEIPKPDFWGGYILRPVEIEFWLDGPFRLHDRLVFRRNTIAEPWNKERLYP